MSLRLFLTKGILWILYFDYLEMKLKYERIFIDNVLADDILTGLLDKNLR
jgi:hypothetical protein